MANTPLSLEQREKNAGIVAGALETLARILRDRAFNQALHHLESNEGDRAKFTESPDNYLKDHGVELPDRVHFSVLPGPEVVFKACVDYPWIDGWHRICIECRSGLGCIVY
jgi:hypothetical protein